MDKREFDDAHYYLRESLSDLERARYHISKANIVGYAEDWMFATIKRSMNTVLRILEYMLVIVKSE